MYNGEGAKFLLEVADLIGGLRGKSVCELGNQHIYQLAKPVLKTDADVAREWFVDTAGVSRYVSIDLNGEDGAIKLDLSRQIPVILYQPWIGYRFDLVTNIGTLEHVMPREAQFECLRNMHELCSVGGVMLHSLTPPGQWLDHCWARHDEAFVKLLARLCKYDVLMLRRDCLHSVGGHVDHIHALLRKTAESTFPTDTDARLAIHDAIDWQEPVYGTGK